MGRVVQETEVDRTERALAAGGAKFPLPKGAVELVVDPEVAESPGGQKLLTLTVNELARMKGVVSAVHLPDLADVPVLDHVPVDAESLRDGLAELIESLNGPDSLIRAKVSFTRATDPAAVLTLGSTRAGALRVGADGWRGMLGAHAEASDWSTPSPIGPGLGAALATAEVFKRILDTNRSLDSRRELVNELTFSAFNYGIDADAAKGPGVRELELSDWVVVGCGAGGTAALYVLAMIGGLRGKIGLIEPGEHKLSNLNRYLMTSAADVYGAIHKLDSVRRHLSRFAPYLELDPRAVGWEQVKTPPWHRIVCTVDTVEARWNIQARAMAGSEILDAAVNGLYYGLLRVREGGWCLQCKHPYDPDHALKARAKRWGQSPEVIRKWQEKNIPITEAMVMQMAKVQARPSETWQELVGRPFREVPQLTECGDTPLRTDVPSAAPVLPIATTAAGVMLAAEIVKEAIAPNARLANWWGHDLGTAPLATNLRNRSARGSCPRH
jgi:molybdopterin/thiamine biosynthesis adenylyltransferase